ncbi:MAG TPA: hypothetical protein V6D29_14255 [Leptolyngbyaceae cyanobacterium]
MKPLSYHCDTPAVQKLEARYGTGLRELPPITRMAVIAALASAAHASSTVGVSECLDVLFIDTIADTPTWAEQELYTLLKQLDTELDEHQAIALVAGIAGGLAYAGV